MVLITTRWRLRPDLFGQFRANPAFLRSSALIAFGTGIA